MLGVFGKTELNVVLEGCTDDLVDQSVDSFSRAFNYMMEQCNAPHASIKVVKRGYAP